MTVKKVFISQPMKGKTEEEILTERNMLIKEAEILAKKYGEEIEVLSTYFNDFNGNALEFLGKSISMLAKADIAVFAASWENARGCRIEHECAKEYGITTIEL